jgi:competence protein ComFA
LAEGGRVCLATPRIDVVNELYPRLSAAFAVTIGKYHGREEKEAANEQLVIWPRPTSC